MPAGARRLSFYNLGISFNIDNYPPIMSKSLSIMIVAGEASGDAHAAKLVRALREACPNVELDIFGAAGPKMREQGADPIVRSDDLAIVGLVEIAAAMPRFLSAFRQLKRAVQIRRPDAVILVDFPDFNLKLARAVKKQGSTVIYYISPQLWAWRKHRVGSIKKYVDLMLTILPFEKEWYAGHGIHNVEYVGNPLAREVHAVLNKAEFCRKHGLDPTKLIISLLPGSRNKEIARILPVMAEAAWRIALQRPDVQFLAATMSERQLKAVRPGTLFPDNFHLVFGETYDALRASDAAAITSGTATLEAAILGTPMAVVYKTSAINYGLLAPMIDVKHYGLVNLIAGKRVAAEFIQNEFTPDALSTELLRLLEPAVNKAMREELKAAADKLGHGGASKRAAEAVLRTIAERTGQPN